MRIILFVFILSLFMASCQQENKTANNDNANLKNKTERTIYLSVNQLYGMVDSLAGKIVNVSGMIEHVCKHGGKRFKIIGTEGFQELKIELGSKFSPFEPTAVGSTAKIVGLLTPNEMNAEMVKEWEEKMKKNHEGEEGSTHFKEELAYIQSIHKKIKDGEIPFYTAYSVIAKKIEIE